MDSISCFFDDIGCRKSYVKFHFITRMVGKSFIDLFNRVFNRVLLIFEKKNFFWIFFCHYLVIYFVDFYWLSNFDETHVQEYLMVYYINKNVRSKFVMVNFRDKIETKLQSEPLHFPTNLYFLSRTLWFWPKNMMEGCKMELFPFFKKK